MKKFELTMRHTVAIVSYIAASMGYSKEEIKYIAGNMKFGSDDIGEFYEILAEPLNDIVSVKRKDEVKDLIQPFNLVERIQMVIDLILKKSNSTETIDMKPTAAIYGFSPYKFSNFIRKPEEKPMSAREEYLRDEAEIEKFDEERLEMLKEHDKQHELLESIDEAVRKATDETLRDFKDKLDGERWKEMIEEAVAKINGDAHFSSQANMYNRPFYSRPFSHMNKQMHSNFVPGSSPFSSKHIVNEVDEINQVIDNLIGFRDRLIAKLGHDQFKEKEQPKQDSKVDLDAIKETPEPYEPVKFTEEQRQRQREILGNPSGSTSRYDQIANEKVRKLSEYSIRESSPHLFDKTLRNRTEEEAMISRSIEIYPSTNLCKDSLDGNNFKEMFSFVRVDGDRLYHINGSSVQPWDRNKPLCGIRLVDGNLGFLTPIKALVKFIVKVNEDAIKEYVDKYFDNPYVILEAVNNKYGFSITPDEIAADSSFETPNQYLFRCSYYRVADELKESLKKDRIKLIKGLVRDSAIVVINDMELTNWLKGKNPTNS